ncbi:MAG: type II toxin-antitoxin system VapC family toxin [Reichenbachiella sp.]|uniref:type II toxin-antitoxin system VapC family toxin n=1 Tax=Reichenbachiella sp. TaxID=2184521 RepID=UPI0029662580|nr:type II toxin-antitoxin system VapC family toxin [Reichenbachiella sp.]MDW3209551.1 type II toxin-antitoxin system VapC family toxin [Reichenbachiella sp.]
MNGNRLFVDTNILIYLLNGDPEVTQILDGKQLAISIITELELLAVPNLSKKEQSLIEQLINDCQVINISSGIKKVTIEIRKSRRLKLPDAIVAASSFYSKLPLLTADKAFEKIDELDVIIYSAE